MFKRAIVRTPGKSLVQGLSTAGLGLPDYKKALNQHLVYITALEECGLEVLVLPPDENYPDSAFVEDVALLTPLCAIITNPGAPTRQGETTAIKSVLEDYFSIIEEIRNPGSVEAGDIMMVGSHYYIGLSDRTNPEGARQMIEILEKNSLSGSSIELKDMLHLKTGVAYLENNNLLACGEMLTKSDFQQFNIIPIAPDESYAANSIWVNGTVIMPRGYSKARKSIQEAGYQTREVDVSEFQKLDGGVSCLSLRF